MLMYAVVNTYVGPYYCKFIYRFSLHTEVQEHGLRSRYIQKTVTYRMEHDGKWPWESHVPLQTMYNWIQAKVYVPMVRFGA